MSSPRATPKRFIPEDGIERVASTFQWKNEKRFSRIADNFEKNWGIIDKPANFVHVVFNSKGNA